MRIVEAKPQVPGAGRHAPVEIGDARQERLLRRHLRYVVPAPGLDRLPVGVAMAVVDARHHARAAQPDAARARPGQRQTMRIRTHRDDAAGGDRHRLGLLQLVVQRGDAAAMQYQIRVHRHGALLSP
ncbi:Uncharacterised protein [Bordetella pertussis]|nr:Uncharacterised protein [Bordetella pertussis]